MAVKLIAFDLDGTLLSANKEISPENLAALKEAAERGIFLVPASGRLYPGLPDELHGPDFRYSILGNGLTVYDCVGDRKLFEYPIPLDLTLALFDYAESIGSFYDVYADDLAWMTASVYDDLEDLIGDVHFCRMLKKLRRPVPDLRRYLEERGKPVQKVLFYFSDPEERKRQLRLLPELWPELNVTSSIYCNIEINSGLADKGLALAALCRELELDPSETMVFGDGINDLGMFKTAGLSVAMANAEDVVLAAAKEVTLSCDESGVAAAIRRWALG